MLELAKMNAEKERKEEYFRRQEREMQEQRKEVQKLREELQAALALIQPQQVPQPTPPASEPAPTMGTSSSSRAPQEPEFNVIVKKDTDFQYVCGDSVMSESHTSIDYAKLDGTEE